MNTIFHTGFADEAGLGLATQIQATRDLGWSAIEMRGVEVPGFPAATFTTSPTPLSSMCSPRSPRPTSA